MQNSGLDFDTTVLVREACSFGHEYLAQALAGGGCDVLCTVPESAERDAGRVFDFPSLPLAWAMISGIAVSSPISSDRSRALVAMRRPETYGSGEYTVGVLGVSEALFVHVGIHERTYSHPARSILSEQLSCAVALGRIGSSL